MKKKKGGITLVAVIITIIVLIILASVIIIAVQNTSLMGKSDDATLDYATVQKQDTKEMDSLDNRLKNLTSKVDAITEKKAYYGTDPELEDEGKDDPKSVYNVLKVGDYVKLKCNIEGIEGEQIVLCKVLYDKSYNETNGTNYGIQLFALEPTEKVTLGFKDPRVEAESGLGESKTTFESDYVSSKDSKDFERAQWSYNHAIETLDKIAKNYTGENIKSTRCIGSLPNNPTYDETGMFTSDSEITYIEDYNGKLKNKDNNYEIDYKQLEIVGELPVKGKCYWLASYNIHSIDKDFFFGPRVVIINGSLDYRNLFTVCPNSITISYSSIEGFRPCFTLKSGAQVTKDDSHDGKTAITAYEL